MRKTVSFLLLSFFIVGLSPINVTVSQNNALDDEGKKTGYWIIVGNMSKLEGYADDAKVEEGEFQRNRKFGEWKKYFPSGNIQSEIEYKNGRARGKFVLYYDNENHQVEQGGNWKGGVYVGEMEMFYSDGTPKQKKTFNQNGETEGKVTYWYSNGKKELEFETVNGIETGAATWYYENGDVKKTKNFVNGAVESFEDFERENVKYEDPNKEKAKKGPEIQGEFNAANELKDGYGKTYDGNGNILMDGEFKEGKLFHGRHYIYDEFGLLDHIEVYKDGVYAGNGVIGAKDKY